jgi:hypothetical protein
MIRLGPLTGLIVCGLLSSAGPACGDAVTDWHAIAIQTIAGSSSPSRRDRRA